MFHKHDWEVLDKHVSPGMPIQGAKAWGSASHALLDAAREKVTWLAQCKTCKKIKRF